MTRRRWGQPSRSTSGRGQRSAYKNIISTATTRRSVVTYMLRESVGNDDSGGHVCVAVERGFDDGVVRIRVDLLDIESSLGSRHQVAERLRSAVNSDGVLSTQIKNVRNQYQEEGTAKAVR